MHQLTDIVVHVQVLKGVLGLAVFGHSVTMRDLSIFNSCLKAKRTVITPGSKGWVP